MAGETRDTIIEAATVGFTDQGYHGCGVSEILKRAGVPKGSFYHFFDSKEDLATVSLRRYAAAFAAMLDGHLAGSEAPARSIVDALAEATRMIDDVGCGPGCLLGSMANELAESGLGIVEEIQSLFDGWTGQIRAALERAVALDQLAGDLDVESLADFILNGWEGAVLRARLDKEPRPLQAFVEHLGTYLESLAVDG